MVRNAETRVFRVEPYMKRPASYLPHDPRAAEVADWIGARIVAECAPLAVEHFGSTAVPGCAGKGIIDLAIFYPAGGLDVAKRAMDTLGFQRQSSRDPFPEDRPMRVGAVSYGGLIYNILAHVIAADSPELEQLRIFRDRLRADPAFRADYESTKRRLIESGVTDSVAYCEAKGFFIQQVLA